MKYLAVGLITIVYGYSVWYVMELHQNVVYNPEIIKLGETYANSEETSEYRELTQTGSK